MFSPNDTAGSFPETETFRGSGTVRGGGPEFPVPKKEISTIRSLGPNSTEQFTVRNEAMCEDEVSRIDMFVVRVCDLRMRCAGSMLERICCVDDGTVLIVYRRGF